MNLENVMSNKRAAEFRLEHTNGQPVLKLYLPKGASFAEASKYEKLRQEIIRGLTGCPACTSGVPYHISDDPVILVASEAAHVVERANAQIGARTAAA
ncbi:hypothetical protein ISN75_09235 [Dyella marensis]|uniref:hypothetical protein n=1 Tax=Dyella marensis TaxID=500610 RepID=UPI0031E04775